MSSNQTLFAFLGWNLPQDPSCTTSCTDSTRHSEPSKLPLNDRQKCSFQFFELHFFPFLHSSPSAQLYKCLQYYDSKVFKELQDSYLLRDLRQAGTHLYLQAARQCEQPQKSVNCLLSSVFVSKVISDNNVLGKYLLKTQKRLHSRYCPRIADRYSFIFCCNIKQSRLSVIQKSILKGLLFLCLRSSDVSKKEQIF